MTVGISAREEAQIAQRIASDPAISAWVGASAGSGKTKVLTDRVLRLLLQEGQAANRILCLTFTRAAAAEMQTRLARRLGEWACAEDDRLAADLAALGCEPSPALLRRARLLFAEVLELPGGMRISTIHSFCQSLLGAFPLEAGLPPQFAVLEDADAAALLADAREAVLSGGAAPREKLALLAALAGAEEFSAAVAALLEKRDRLAACLRASNGMAGLRFRLARALRLDDGEDEAAVIASACMVPDAVAREAAAWMNHRNKQPRELAEKVREFLALDHEGRATRWEEWCDLFLTAKGEPRKVILDSPALAAEARRILGLREKRAACRLLEATEALLALAGPVLDHYEARKRSAGLLAYDDLIAVASRVLRDPGSAWVLFKLDGGLDHVLLDEAQDTNPAQWEIASALTEEFFAGFGAELAGRGERLRTIFAVGDTKQSIYGFQGADAQGFGTWEARFRKRVSGRGGASAFRKVDLKVSFRSTAPVLALVDAVFAEGAARDGVVAEGETLEHRPDRAGQAGSVELWPLLRPAAKPKPAAWDIPEEPQRVADETALMAEALAARIARMVAEETLPARAVPGPDGAPRPRRIRPGDILVLVRRIANVKLVPLLVRALKERGVPVAGVGRLKLVEHIAVQDLLALLDVLLLPEDDLQLAALLKSPLVGLSEEELFALAHGRSGSLWSALLAERGADSAAGRAAEWIARLADRADLCTPHALLAEVLGEPCLLGPGGRARLLARLGPDAAEPLDEVLTAALAYERKHPPSLQGFVHWLRRGGAEVKREAESGADAVRIMTVHNAKGLQAPVVILPDVGGGEGREVVRWAEGDGTALPLWAPRKEFHAPAYLDTVAEDARKRQQEENRLLYVALTRAEDRLLVCGWGEEPREWYRFVAEGFRRLDGARQEPFDPAAFGAPPACDFGGGMLWRLDCPQQAAPAEDRPAAADLAAGPLPPWVHRPAPPEAPEAAIAPSALPGEQETPAAAPHGGTDPEGRRFRRGRLVHALLQHLPGRPEAERREAGRRFLARPGHGLSAEEQAEVLEEVLALIGSPAIAEAFGPDSLAEAPIAGRVGGQLVAGQVDRLVVRPDRVLVLDYKTNRPPPARAEEVAPLYLRQMAAYRAVLRQAFPGRAVACALVWTYGASLMPLPEALLDAHAPG
ncbi:double-strand break repair helicase AddA [Crenalkalicoccus roseus]|uniref:double-strand break repair helicase AddA n=1 Tax=Crenalkalicoccus roseus TaxID=1485588 RepID=UPI001081096F|nr:double-strand break repair helicase AddA [Crenalkalicoccus roseus]